MESIRLHRGHSLGASKGFTLVELMVVAGIITVISAIVFSNQTSFNNTLTLANAAYDVALTIRSAQSFGVGGRTANVAGSPSNVGYGVHFQSIPKNTFTLFADTNPPPNAANCHGLPLLGAGSPNAQPGDCLYAAGSDLNVTNYALGNGVTISDFCVYDGSGTRTCITNGLTALDITFARPNQEAFIMGISGGTHSLYQKACFTLSSPQGAFRYITLTRTGQINANASPCP